VPSHAHDTRAPQQTDMASLTSHQAKHHAQASSFERTAASPRCAGTSSRSVSSSSPSEPLHNLKWSSVCDDRRVALNLVRASPALARFLPRLVPSLLQRRKHTVAEQEHASEDTQPPLVGKRGQNRADVVRERVVADVACVGGVALGHLREVGGEEGADYLRRRVRHCRAGVAAGLCRRDLPLSSR
jgi:hypothetical protein